tara:strand:- start:2657 stop:3877 length:1221 start_codon:yes stop_codon:yes gene_type:complete
MNEIDKIIELEKERQSKGIELIASENFVSDAVMRAAGSVMTNKYAEGYPGRRYYGGCEFVDEVEVLAQESAKKLFNAKFVNVQPHSGSQANMAVFFSILSPGDRVLAMDLSHGGHLTHGFKLNFSGMLYDTHFYGVEKGTEVLDYEKIEDRALDIKPKLIIAGGSAYSRKIDFKRFGEIAKKVGAYLLVDMAHIAGLVATGLHENPMPYADFVTSTTHKTLRGPRGGIILTNNEDLYKKVNRSLFPGIQGGPLMHIIAAKAVCFSEALEDSFTKYQQQVLCNAKTLSDELKKRGFRIVSGGTDNHLFLVDLRDRGIKGNTAEDALYQADITVNKNSIPFDEEKPLVTSGLRIGTPAVTTRGMKESEMIKIADLADRTLSNLGSSQKILEIKKEVHNLTSRFGMYDC